MLSYLLKDSRKLILIATDLFVLTGVLFMDWNPARMIGFYYLDVCFCILSFLIYHLLLRRNYEYLSMFMATAIILATMYFLFYPLTEINYQLNYGDYRESPFKLFVPYYDVALYSILAFTAHILNVRKYLKYNSDTSKPAFSLYLGLVFLMIPTLWVLTFSLQLIQLSLKVSLVLSLILIRNFTEYRRGRGFIAIRKEAAKQAIYKQ
jgi:hypothetical protein